MQDYNREIHYEVRDENDTPMAVSGLTVEETYERDSSQNSCNVSRPLTASATTNSQGRFKDNYYVTPGGIPACDSNPNCTTRFVQRIKVSNILVRTNEVIYGCASVTVNQQ